ncbi:MAG: prolyl oligopeptidase family serine peptidase [Saprospiraceae bacterium]|nr:prolyl oligopeptidase family serine peptidase [Saprospiraceae bacterium]
MALGFFCLLFFVTVGISQAVPNRSNLNIAQIMQGEKFVGFSPTRIRWSDDNETIYFSWNPNQDTLRSWYKVGMDGGAPQVLELEEEMQLPLGGTYNKDRTKKVYVKNGDLFLQDFSSGATQQLTNTVGRESNPAFSGDEQKLIYQSGSNIFSWDLSSGQLQQLTDFRSGSPRKSPGSPEYKSWLEEDQLAYFGILKQRKEVRDLRSKNNKEREVKRPLKIYSGNKRISNQTLSPDGKFVSFRLTRSSSDKGTKVPNFVTESGFVEDISARSKVGSPQSSYELGVYDIEKDTFWILDTKQIEGIYDKPAYLVKYHKGEEEYSSTYSTPRDVIVHGPFYAENSQAVVVVRSLDNKDRWIMHLDLSNGELKTLDWQHDEAWVGGPGVSGWNFFAGTLGWMPNNEEIYYQSESTGFSHLYTVNVKTGKKKALTNGKFEVLSAQLSNDKTNFWITANAEGPAEQHFYRLPVGGGKLERITAEKGNHQVTLSPDEQWLAVRYSYSNKPWELYLQKNEAGAARKQLTESTTAAFRAYPWKDPQLVTFKAEDGATVSARLYRPQKPKRKGPAVIFVHGAGYLQNVHAWWSSYYREYMFHNILVDNGYTVLDIDYRGSAGYGRNWRTGIYRFMGGKDLSDQIDGAKYLVDELNIDPDRIGIYGGSYGGFITLMGLFTSPGTFKAGAALRSVTDWAHYNHSYTSNILNTPVQDSIAYRKSSPIYHAEGLQDHLLILHGMIDDNVQFQDVVRLAQRLIELEKDNWEFAVFPVERHGFVEPSSWTDEYKRIFKLFQQHLQK